MLKQEFVDRIEEEDYEVVYVVNYGESACGRGCCSGWESNERFGSFERAAKFCAKIEHEAQSRVFGLNIVIENYEDWSSSEIYKKIYKEEYEEIDKKEKEKEKAKEKKNAEAKEKKDLADLKRLKEKYGE